jgi:hypothetical protein
VVEDEPERRAESRDVELLRPPQAVLLRDGEYELQTDRSGIAHMPGGELHQHRHRGLVVGAEDRVALASKDTVLHDDLDRSVVRDRVEV